MADKTPKPLWNEKELELLEKLRDIRTRKEEDFKPLPPTPILRTEIVNLAGKLEPLRLRYYQVQAVLNMLVVKRMVLGDGTGLGKCVTGDTLLSTDQGLIPIRQLAPEQPRPDTFYNLKPMKVWNGSEMVPVGRFYWNGEAPTKKIRTRNGYEIEGSFQHPILVRGPEGETFQKLPDLQGNTYVCLDRRPAPFPAEDPYLPPVSRRGPNAKEYTYPTRLTPELARLLGYIVGEAWTNGKDGVNVSQYSSVNPESHADIRRLFHQVFGWVGNQKSQSRDFLIAVSSRGIREFLLHCGVAYVTSHDKDVPWCILRATAASMKEFLRGLFEAEGSVGEGGVELATSSRSLARGVHQLLLRFGIVSRLSPKRVKGRSHTYWRICFFGEDARIFSQEVGFVSERKSKALLESFSDEINPNKDVVPYLGKAVADLKEALLEATTKTGANDLRRGSGLKQFGESFQSTLKHITQGHRNPTYQFLRRLLKVAAAQGLERLPAFQELSQVVTRHYYYDPVVEIQEGFGPLMDLEVDHPTHCFSGGGVINHNTVETIATLAYLWAKFPQMKVLVVSPKSATRQWVSEVAKFTEGVDTFLTVSDGSGVEGRRKIYEAWAASTKPSVLVMNYALLIRDWNHGGIQPLLPNGRIDPKKPVVPGLLDKIMQVQKPVVIFDEATAFKSHRTKTWEVAGYLSSYVDRVYALTATILKNNLMEGFNILRVVRPGLFTTQQSFFDDYCYIEYQRVKRSQRIPIVVGYKNLDKFRERIELVYLGRPKHMVSKELPTLTTREIPCELSQVENLKYEEALSGILALGDGSYKAFEETKALTSLIYCQEVVNSLSLIKYQEGDSVREWDDPVGQKVGSLSSKEEALVELLEEDLEGDKVIVYTRFASHIPRLQEILKKRKIQSVRITGKDKDAVRKKNQDAFQDPKSKVRVIFITAAGSEAINLQAAAATVFFDMPWSWGDYVQILGRMIRIGSPHVSVLCYHLIAERPGQGKLRKTIDHHVLSGLRKKKNLIDKVLGEAAVGALKFEKDEGNIKDLIKSLREDATNAV